MTQTLNSHLMQTGAAAIFVPIQNIPSLTASTVLAAVEEVKVSSEEAFKRF